MAAYTFHGLSDADFEDLACDLLCARLGLTFQPFTKGRDSGIDLLHGARIGGNTIVQCKHMWRSGYTKLKAGIAKDERPKIAKLKPQRFILVTSVGLTPQNKEDLLCLLRPHCKGVDDIYGADDINALLRINPTVEIAHYKLWLTSVPVLQRILKQCAFVWNVMTKADIERKTSLYVQTAAYGFALELLAKHHYCVLSGIPGIGKTTLAQVLVTKLMNDGYELLAVRDDIAEALEHLDLRRKQVVYYDDFLGQSSIAERLGKNEDKGIVRLLNEASRAKHLKVILTTREYILEDAKRVYERLNGGELDVAKCIVKVEDYTRGHRARILYNHVFFSDLPQPFAEALLKDRAYRRVIDHKGYVPRIIEWMTLGAGRSGVAPADFAEAFVEALDNPTKLWEHVFENQITADARAILYCLGTVEAGIGYEGLRDVWARFRKLEVSGDLSIEAKGKFRAAMKQLDGSLIRTTRVATETVIQFHNPSIKDFMLRLIASNADVRSELLRTAKYFDQVSLLIRLGKDGKLTANIMELIDDEVALHAAIARTIAARGATFRFVIDWKNELVLWPGDADVGNRLTLVAIWAKHLKSKPLMTLAFKLASAMVDAGEIARAATVHSCGFLSTLVGSKPLPTEEVVSLVRVFVENMREHLSSNPSTPAWYEVTTFIKANESLFDKAALNEWQDLAHAFCEDEVGVIIDNADTATGAQSWIDDLTTVADSWGVSGAIDESRLKERVQTLEDREAEDVRDDDDFQGTAPPDAMGDGDADIDRLFNSLSDRSRE